ncbi:unnamed protein product, partial [marine sediment metagenome]
MSPRARMTHDMPKKMVYLALLCLLCLSQAGCQLLRNMGCNLWPEPLPPKLSANPSLEEVVSVITANNAPIQSFST